MTVALSGAQVVGDAATAAPAAPAPCLDYRSQSDTRVQATVTGTGTGSKHVGGVPSRARVANRARVYRTGEVEVRTVCVNRASRRPEPPCVGSQRWTRGVSRRGRRLIRRAIAVKASESSEPVFLYTLTSQAVLPDEVFADRMRTWLMWLRKYAPAAASSYVWVRDLQARGVLHGHVVLFGRLPRHVWLRARKLWAIRYRMGPGSFDVKRVSARRAAAYVSKYVTQHYDEDGCRVGRNGEPYVAMMFRGNGYGMSASMRRGALPVTEFVLPWGTGPALGAVNLRGCVLFFGSVDEAHDALDVAVGSAYNGALFEGEHVGMLDDGAVQA